VRNFKRETTATRRCFKFLTLCRTVSIISTAVVTMTAKPCGFLPGTPLQREEASLKTAGAVSFDLFFKYYDRLIRIYALYISRPPSFAKASVADPSIHETT